ncbi:MAG: hypothetical protein GY851_22360 [bacterium]|nr:hypothetical protein [bacterium]
MRSKLLILLCLTLVVGAAWASLMPPPPGPIGFETRLAPGFDPPVEYVVAFGEHLFGDPRTRFYPPKVWGPEAVPVLSAMLRDPEWARHRQWILSLLDRFETPATPEALAKEAEALLASAPKDGEDAHAIMSVLTTLAKHDATRADAIALKAVEDSESPYYQQLVYYLQNRSTTTDGAPCRDKLKAIAQSTKDDKLRAQIEHSLESSASVLRAHEPMSIVLEREAGEAKQ